MLTLPTATRSLSQRWKAVSQIWNNLEVIHLQFFIDLLLEQSLSPSSYPQIKSS